MDSCDWEILANQEFGKKTSNEHKKTEENKTKPAAGEEETVAEDIVLVDTKHLLVLGAFGRKSLLRINEKCLVSFTEIMNRSGAAGALL